MTRVSPLSVLGAIGITLVGVAACSNPDDITGKSPAGTLSIRSERDTTADVDTLIVGDEEWLFAKGADTTAATTWTVGDTSIVRILDQVYARVHIKALRIGTTTITAQHDGETGTLQLVVRELRASDTIPRVEITTAVDSLIIGDSIPFGFNIVRRGGEYVFDLPFTMTFSDSSVVRLLPMGEYPRSFWIEGTGLGKTVLTVQCACSDNSMTITVHEPRPGAPDPRASRYEAIDLGTLGGAAAIPLAMNDNGEIVGYSRTADGEQHAFRWTNGAMQDLSFPGARGAAQVVTNSGAIAGTGSIDGLLHIIRWDNGQTTDLGLVSSADRLGGVVGITATDLVAWGEDGSAIWRDGVKQFISGFRARAVNSRHQVAGNIGALPYLWDNGSLIALEISAMPGQAVDINSDGAVLGNTSQWTQYWGTRPTITVWINGRISKTLGNIESVAINDAGDVIGGVGTGAFYSHDGSPWAVSSLGGGWVEARELNDRGLVVGESWTVEKTQHAFVWKVSDEVSSDPPIDLGT